MIKRFGWLASAVWIAFIVLTVGWHLHEIHVNTLESARIQASNSFEKDLVYRRWAAGHGGVYVTETERTPPNPYLSHIKNRDISTTSGLKLTLMNPAYMTRQVHELGRKQYGHQGHITSLNPLRPENAPDAWEAEALRSFERGESEVAGLARIGSVEYMRLMRPMITETGCLKCHAKQGYKVGDLRGGISVSVPMAPLWTLMYDHMVLLTMGYGLLCLLGLGGIGFSFSRMGLYIRERDQAEKELQKAATKWQSTFEAMSNSVSIVDLNGHILQYNSATLKMFTFSDQEIKGKQCWQIVHGLSEPIENCPIVRMKKSKQPESMTFQNKGRWLEVSVDPIFDRTGQIKGAVHVVSEITELKQTQEESLKRKQFLESVFYHAPDAVVTLDPKHRVVDWNRGAVTMFGYTPEEAIGVQLDDLVARGESHVEAGDKTKQVLSGQRVEAFETVRYRKDGTSLRVIAAGSPIIIDGAVKGVVAVYTDITDRVRTENALRESEQKFRTLVQESPFGIALIGKDGRYLYANPEFKNMFGYTIEDIPTGAAWFRKVYPDKAYRDTVVQTWEADLKQTADGQARPRVFTVTCKDGSRKDINFRPVTMENMNQFVIYEDITEKTKLERQLQQTQKFEAVGTLAGGIAHDFNNLLMGIQGRASLISVELEPSHPHLEHIKAIEDYIRSATDLTKQLLGFARGGKYEVRPIDINELLLESSTMFGRTKKEIRIHTKLHNPPPVVVADRKQIEQVLLNLYINAWQAMPDGGELYLETKIVALDKAYCKPYQAKPGRYAKVSVTDTGIGMDESIYQRIFDPFFTTKEKTRGTGLGLSSAYGIIKNHAGIIAVYSEVGQGTTFNIYLPVSHAAAYRDVPTETELVKGSETVLLVDDEEMIIKVAQAMLEKLGYRVVVATDGKQAVDTVKSNGNEIDLVILDLIMPGIKGGKTFDLIREIQPAMPVILSSGYSLNGQTNDIMKRGCNGFIQKPFNISELSQKVRKILDEAKSSAK